MSGVSAQKNRPNNNRTPFANTYAALLGLIVKIQNVAGTGNPIPASIGAPAGATDASAAAYGTAYGDAKTEITSLVTGFANSEILYFSGLEFTTPNNVASCRTDVINSVISAWDKAAASFMKNDTKDGNAGKVTLLSRLEAFDATYQTAGKVPIAPDK